MVGLLEKATRQHTRDHNSQLVLRAIYDSDQISRAELARLTRLTRTTVSDVVADLIARGLVEEIGHGLSSGGRMPIMLAVNDDSRHLIGVNLLNDELSGATINLRGSIRQRARRGLARSDAESVLALLYELVDELVARATSPLLGIGISTPGLMDPSEEVVRRAVNFGWQDLHLKALLTSRYRLPVYMGNLAHLAALAEYTFGSGQKRKNLVVIHIGQGIGAGIILQGELFHGDAYGAGEIGHASVVEAGQLCNCGNYGCLETVADIRAIVRRAQQLIHAGRASSIGQAAGAVETISLESVARAFHGGDRLAEEIIDEIGRYLGIAVAQLVSVLNVERIVITGPVARFGEQLGEIVEREMRKRSLPTLAQTTRVVVVEEEPDTILLGISALLLKHELGLSRLAPGR
ncbi:MAG TPA: ROK family transcriptional regulator [Roseiflexaceae bacterium]|nr:ROK family transcriptional regulator [Roseiflexaceae bacterium]